MFKKNIPSIQQYGQPLKQHAWTWRLSKALSQPAQDVLPKLNPRFHKKSKTKTPHSFLSSKAKGSKLEQKRPANLEAKYLKTNVSLANSCL